MAKNYNPARGMGRWIGNIFFVVGLALLTGAWLITRDTVDLLNIGVPAQGIVINLVESRDSDGSTYAPLVEVTSREHGVFRFKSSLSSNPPSFSVGEKVDVIVDPDDKDRVIINSFGQKWFMPAIFTFIGSVFSLIGLF